MKHLFLAIIFGTMFCACSHHEVRSNEGNFSICFPGSFKADTVEFLTLGGLTNVYIYSYKSTDNTVHYQAAYNYLPGKEEIVPDSLFQNLIAGPALQLKPMSIQRQDTIVDGQTRVRYHLLGINSATVYDIYLMDRDVYQLAIINYEPRIPTDKEIEAFMGSFKLLEK